MSQNILKGHNLRSKGFRVILMILNESSTTLKPKNQLWVRKTEEYRIYGLQKIPKMCNAPRARARVYVPKIYRSLTPIIKISIPTCSTRGIYIMRYKPELQHIGFLRTGAFHSNVTRRARARARAYMPQKNIEVLHLS